MDKRKLQKRLVHATYDKTFFNRTMLRYYKNLRTVSEVLDGKKGKKKKQS